jgi:hypothetical protein
MSPVLAVISAVSTVASISASSKASKASAGQQALQAARERRQAFRQTQIQRAQMMNSGVSTGGQDGSALAGGQASLSSQLGTNLGYGTQMSGISRQINMYNARASMFEGIAGLAGGLSNYNFGAAPASPALPTSSFGGGS